VTTYVALLRAVNVSGRNKVNMRELAALLSGVGLELVSTYVQSGNIVFRSSAGTGDVTGTIGDAITRELGLDVTVLVRTRAALARVAAESPFVSSDAPPSQLHVAFLAGAPTRRGHETAGVDGRGDEFVVRRREVYLRLPGGVGRTKLNNAYRERALGVGATMRNWRTVTTLLDMAARA
jgi:uncharacterized protein (DUF1697 family)